MKNKFTNTQKLILGLIALLILARFSFSHLFAFIGDEPAIQLTIDHAIENGRFPWVGHESTFGGIRHPGFAFWVYRFVKLVSDTPLAMSLTQVVLSTLGVLGVAFAIFRSALGVNAALVFLLLTLSSPFLFFYSRLPWDNNFQVFSIGLFVFLNSYFKNKKLIHGFLIGCALGFMGNVHLMAVSSVLAAICTLVCFLKKSNKAWVFAAASGFIFVMTPYLSHLVLGLMHKSLLARVDRSDWSLSSVFYDLKSMNWYFNAEGFGYFMDGTLRPLKQWTGKLLGLFFEFDYSFFLRTAAFFGLYLALKELKNKSLQFLDIFAVLSLLFLLFYYRFAHPDFGQPHYYMPLWWVGFYFVVKTMDYFKTANIKYAVQLNKAALFFAALTVLANTVITGAFLKQIHAHQGTIGVHMSTLPKSFSESVNALCEQAIKTNVCVDISNTKGLFESPFRYFFKRLESCKNKQVYVFGYDQTQAEVCKDIKNSVIYKTYYLGSTARFAFKD